MLTYASHNVGKIEFDGDEPLARGPWIGKFEAALAQEIGAKHAVAVNSGTSALYLAVRALDLTGKRIAVPSITFCGTANAVICAGAIPVYADVSEDGCISLHWLATHQDEYDAILPVHYAGNAIPLVGMRSSGKPIIVDACHALGARGLMEHADAVCFSFHPAKQITTGEGGAVLTDNAGIDYKLRSLRHNGIVSRYDASGIRQNAWIAPSLNFWMSDVAAKIGCEQLSGVQSRKWERQNLAREYLHSLPTWTRPLLPVNFANHALCMFPVLLAPDFPIPRYALMTELLRRGIETQIHYHPLHLQPMGGGKPGDLPGAADFGARELTLPLHNRMSTDDVLRVCAALKEIHG